MSLNKDKFRYWEIERIIYIWGRYEGRRDSSKYGKYYTESDLNELIERLKRFLKNPQSFIDGFEKELCLKCGFMKSQHTENIRKRNKKEGEPYPCKEFTI